MKALMEVLQCLPFKCQVSREINYFDDEKKKKNLEFLSIRHIKNGDNENGYVMNDEFNIYSNSELAQKII